MHFTEGRIYMNQENKTINVYLEKREKSDFMVFEFDKELAVCLNEENGQSELKNVFSILLTELIKNPIKLEYKENKDYKVVLYIDVCKEYLKDLNREISNVRKNMPERLSNISLNRA